MTREARRRRRASLLSGTLVLVTVAALVVSAANAEGYTRANVDLRDEGVWVLRGSERAVGYISKATARLELKFAASTIGGARLSQSGDTLVLHEGPLGSTQSFSASTAMPVASLPTLAEGDVFAHVGAFSARLRSTTGEVVRAPAEQLNVLADDAGEPLVVAPADRGHPAAFGIGTDGSVHVVSTLDASVVTVSPQGVVGEARPLVAATPDAVQVSAAAGQALVLDAEERVLHLPLGGTVDLGGYGANPVLQQPSQDPATALVATDTSLLAVDLPTGEITVLVDGGTGDAAAPVRFEGFSFTAWSAERLAYRVDPDGGVVVYDDSGTPAAGLVWQVGRALVVLNDVVTGDVVFEDEQGDIRRIDPSDWLNALDRSTEQEEETGRTDSEESSTTLVREDEETATDQQPPEPQDDSEFGTREGRPVIVPVLLNDRDPNGDLLLVTGVRDVQGGDAGIVGAGAAVRFWPSGSTPGSFVYTVSDGFHTAEARATVEVYPDSDVANQPPRKLQGARATDVLEVGVGTAFEVNLLRGWFDPEGDAFVIDGAPAFDPPDAAGWFAVSPEGHMAGRAYATGSVTITYFVVDEFRGGAEGELEIEVVDDARVEAYPDSVVARPGETAVVDVLANDLGGDLRIGPVTVPGERVTAQGVDGGRRLAVRADEPGEYTLTYEAHVEGRPDDASEAAVRLIVPPHGPDVANDPPVTAPDLLVVKPGVAGLVDVLRSDYDPNADVLVVTDARSDVPGVEVSVVDHRYVRVLVEDFPRDRERVLVRYAVSDGQTSAEGLVVVLRDTFSGDRPPILRDDYRTVRAGGVVVIPALSNDAPAGSPLRLAAANPLSPGSGGGEWTVNGDEVVFVAPDTEGFATATYRVEGFQQEATIRVMVTRLENGSNVTLDRLPDVTARTVSGGEVVIPLPLGVDPDGDRLVPTGAISPSTDPLGTVRPPTEAERDRGVLVYRAESTRHGLDSFTYEVEEVYGDRRVLTGRVWVGVAPPTSVREAPVANPDIVWVRPGETRRIDVLSNDTPSGSVELVRVDPVSPEHGKAVLDDPDQPRFVVYTAPEDVQRAQYALRYQAGLGGLRSTSTITVHVMPDRPNLPPVVTNGTVRLSPGETGTFDVLSQAYDPDGDSANLAVGLDPRSRVGRVEGGRVVLEDATTSSTVFFVVTDEDDAATVGYVRFEVENRPPTSSWTPPQVDGGEPQVVVFGDHVSDPDGDDWSVQVVGQEVNGRVTASDDETVEFVPDDDTEHAQFTALIEDARGRSGSVVFDFRVLTNRPPSPLPVTIGVPSRGADRTVTIDPGDPDPTDAGTHEIVGACQSSSGIHVQRSGRLELAISSDLLMGASGTVSCVIRDSRQKEGTATVTVNVEGTDRPRPAAHPLSFELTQADQGGRPVSHQASFEDPLEGGVTVEVRGSPSEIGVSVSGTTITVTPPASGFSGQLSFTYYVIDAEGRQAESTVTVLVRGVPRAPTAPQAAAADRQVTVTWAPPPPNGVPVHSYVVQPSTGASQEVRGGTSATFSGLQNNTPYTFTVEACHDEWGCGEASPPSAQAIPDAPPLSPLDFQARRGDQFVDLSWRAGESGGSELSEYVIECGACGETRTVPASQSSLRWDGLSNGTTYAFSLTARKRLASTGEQVRSPAASVSAIPAGVPFAPSVGTPGRRDDGAVTVTWQEPSNNGDPITDYDVRVDGASGGACARSGLSAVCTGIPTGSSIQVGVRAVNAEGAGAEGLSPSVVTAAKPATPTVAALQGNGETAQLTLSVADSGGVALRHFEIHRNGASIGTFTASGSGPNYAVTVPTPIGGPYTFRARAQNTADFWSDGFSADSRAVKGQGVPALSVTGSSGSNTLSWDVNVNWRNSDPGNITWSQANPQNVSCGTSRSNTVTVRYSWDGQQRSVQGSATATAAACPQPTVTIYYGPHATDPPRCDSSTCRRIMVNWEHFPPNRNVTVSCSDAKDTDYYSYTQNTGSGSGTHGVCINGEVGIDVWVHMDGIRSNNIRQ